MIFFIFIICSAIIDTEQYKILAIFPHSGRSHHIFFSALVEELAARKHEVTVINYFPSKNMSNLHQISLQDDTDEKHTVNIEDRLRNSSGLFTSFYKAYDSVRAFKHTANKQCGKLLANKHIRVLLTSKIKFDLVIVEQFVTDCGLAIAYKLSAPVVGMTTHVLMPWSYSRLGASNHPAYVPNRFLGTGTKPNFWNRLQSFLISFYTNMYYSWVIQKSDQKIINTVFPDVPNLEYLGYNMSLIMLNQYFPLTGSRLFGANVIEIGGMHIRREHQITDEVLKSFLENAASDVVYISFGTVSSKIPPKVINELRTMTSNWNNITFLWKTENLPNWDVPANVFIKEWLPQLPILCHPKVKAFITHSGMLSTSEALHCGVPIVSVPLFGDQFANAASAVENGLGVTVDIGVIAQSTLVNALLEVLQESYQRRAKRLSEIWRDRPLSPMDTAVYWIEYVAKYKGDVQMKPPTVNLPMYQYLMFDIYLSLLVIITVLVYLVIKVIQLLIRFKRQLVKKNKIH